MLVLHSSLYGVMHWVSAGTSAGNSGMFSLLLSRAYTVRAFSVPHQSVSCGCTRGWGYTAGTADQRDISCLVTSSSAHETGKEEGREDVQTYGVCLPK